MNNLFNLAKSGLSTAQSALSIVGSNLTNGMSPSYSRRDIIIGESGGLTTSNGFYGYGAVVRGVERAYDAFASSQLRTSVSVWSALDARNEQLSDIDNMLGDESDNVSVSLGNLFKAMSTLSDNPSDSASRSAVFNSIGALTQRFNESGKRLSGLEKSTNTQIEQTVKDINSTTEQLAEINQQLERIQAQNGSVPADLLDQRDELLESLGGQIGIEVSENKITGRVDVTLADGRPLVSGEQAYRFSAGPSSADPGKTTVSYIGSDGKATELDESRITKGRLAGLFIFRNEDLVTARNELNEMAFMMASRMNQEHKLGVDKTGNAGKEIFNLPDPKAIGNFNNQGSGAFSSIKVDDYSKVKSQDYTISFDGTNWTVTDASGNQQAALPGQELTFDGIKVDTTGMSPSPGDNFTLNPMAGMAEGISRHLTDADQIAVAKTHGAPGDNENIKALLQIQNEKLIKGDTLTGAYTRLVGTIGASAKSVQSGLKSAATDLETKYNTKQALSGVDMNEEMVNMQMFMQYYQANSQILQTATTLFDTLLTIR